MEDRECLFLAGLQLMRAFCEHNKIEQPDVRRLARHERLYHLATCAFYRPYVITIMVEKCALRGYGGRLWSWPGYAIDRTPYGVIQHELGHHVDELKSEVKGKTIVRHFAEEIYKQSLEKPLTSYLGKDDKTTTFYAEWFAENFRLFVTNPDLSRLIRPRFWHAMIAAGVNPVWTMNWEDLLRANGAPPRITDQCHKKIAEAQE